MERTYIGSNGADSGGCEDTTLLNALASAHPQRRIQRTRRRIKKVGSLVFVVAVVLLFSACTNDQQNLQVEGDPSTIAAGPAPEAAPGQQSSTTTVSPAVTPDTTSSTTTPTPADRSGSVEAPTTTAYADIEPVLSESAAKPTPVEIFEPTTAQTLNVVVGANDTETTIAFAATGNGKIEWYSQIPPLGPLTYRGKGSSIDITLTIPIDDDNFTYLITADGKNPNAGEDSITILLTRGSS